MEKRESTADSFSDDSDHRQTSATIDSHCRLMFEADAEQEWWSRGEGGDSPRIGREEKAVQRLILASHTCSFVETERKRGSLFSCAHRVHLFRSFTSAPVLHSHSHSLPHSPRLAPTRNQTDLAVLCASVQCVFRACVYADANAKERKGATFSPPPPPTPAAAAAATAHFHLSLLCLIHCGRPATHLKESESQERDSSCLRPLLPTS